MGNVPKDTVFVIYKSQQSKASFRCKSSGLVMKSMHYRLRCPIELLNLQKKSKSKLLFLTEGIPKSKNFALFVKIMTQILYQKYFITFSENTYGQNHGQCSEKVERGLSKGWIFVWWKYRPHQGKKLKIASFTEAPFLVKLDF